MSSSYQQVPVGIPASQNPYPSIPYSQNFPNEPDTESSQPLNNHPQHYYPPHHVYGQQPVLMNQPGQFYGSNQQPQFMMVPIDPERMGLDRKILDIDITLNSGCYFLYTIWIYLFIFFTSIGGIRLLFFFACAAFDHNFKGSRAIMTVTTLLLVISCAWELQYSFVFKNAMNHKNLKGARRGFKSMIWSNAYSIIITIGMTVALKSKIQILPPDFQEEYSKVPVEATVLITAILIFVQLFGAQKVIELLTEREKLVQEMNTRYGANMA